MQGLPQHRRGSVFHRMLPLWAALVAAVATAEEAPPVPAEAATMGPITFAVIGDFGQDNWKPKSNPVDPTKPHERRNPFQAKVADLVASWKPDLVISTGDNNYPKGEAATIELANGTDYALTAGVYSRSPARLRQAAEHLAAGNIYLNRGITGALVNRQPFGGHRMSGIGSKAGGPEYLLQFMVPRTVTENTMRRGFAPPAPAGG